MTDITNIVIRKRCYVLAGRNLTSKCYTAAVILAPLLGVYSRHGVTLAVVALMLTGGIAVVVSWKEVYLCKELIPLILYVFVDSCVVMFFLEIEDSMVQMLFRTLQYIVFLMLLIVSVKTLFIEIWAEKLYIAVSGFCAIYLIMQYVCAKIFGIYITGLFQNRFFSCNEVLYQMYFDVPMTGRRVPGLFTEPAEHCSYVAGALALLLFHPCIEPKKKYMLAGIISFSIVCSASSTGMILMGFIWALYVLEWMHSRRLMVREARILFFVAVVTPVLLVNMSSFWLFIERIIEGYSAQVRLGGNIVLKELSFFQLLFGCGMQKTFEVYTAGYVRFISYFGIVGLMFYFFLLSKGIRKAEKRYKLLLVVFLMLQIGGATILGVNMVLYMSLFLAATFQKLPEETEHVNENIF